MSNSIDGKAAIRYGFSKENNETYVVSTTRISTAIAKNETFFPNPTPTLVEYDAAITELRDWLAIPNDQRTTNITRQRNLSRRKLAGLTKLMAAYVTMIAKGDVTILSESGFPLAKRPQPTPPINVPANLKVANAGSGTIQASVDPVKNARVLLFQYTEDPLVDTSTWTSITSTKSKLLITGLTPGKKYWIRVAVAGVKEQIKYSMVTSIICS
jgi:hypothetical protein